VRPLFASLRVATAPLGWDIILQTGDFHVGSGPAASVWRVTEASTEGKYATIATALWVDGQPAGAGIAARVNQALNTVRHSAISPVLAVVTHFGGDSPNSARRAMDAFLPRTAPLSESVSKPISVP
jgi:hypothetical protein